MLTICGKCKYYRFGAIVEGNTIRSGWRCDLDDTRTDFGAICKDYEEEKNYEDTRGSKSVNATAGR